MWVRNAIKSVITRKLHHKALRMSRFPCKLKSPYFSLFPYHEKGNDLCRNEKVSAETKYLKFHDSFATHLSVHGINIIALKQKVFKKFRYYAENSDQINV